MKKKNEILTFIFIMAMFIIGGLLGVYLIGKEEGVFDYGVAFSVIGGSVVGISISIFFARLHKKRRGNVPEVDERSLLIMKRYLLGVLYVVLIGSGALLVVLYGLGVHTIEIGILIVYMMILYIVIGIGAVVVKRL